MLSYQHIYHAGNFADVQKHSLLLRLLAVLTADSAPLHLLDTHAGRGFYDLSSAEAAKTGEHLFGVTPLWAQRDDARRDGLIGDYLAAIGTYNKGHRLTRYPGSARLARDVLRTGDTLVAAERHPREFEELEYAFRDDDPATTDLFFDDGLRGLDAAVPPPGARGVIVIDPSYEIKTEYTDIPRSLFAALPAWPDPTVLLWYPILPAGLHQNLLDELVQGPLPGVISEVRLTRPPKPGYRMEGSGIAILNSPWSEVEITALTRDIADALAPACGDIRIDAYAL